MHFRQCTDYACISDNYSFEGFIFIGFNNLRKGISCINSRKNINVIFFNRSAGISCKEIAIMNCLFAIWQIDQFAFY